MRYEYDYDLDKPQYLMPIDKHRPTPTPAEVLDAITARLPEPDQRQRIQQRGATQAAHDDIKWLATRGNAETLVPCALRATVGRWRRYNEAPLYIRPIDIVRRYLRNGWIPEDQTAHLPAQAFQPPQEAAGVGLDALVDALLPTLNSGKPGGVQQALDTLDESGDEITRAITSYAEAAAKKKRVR